ncbi:centromere protein F-like isoform X4 [Varroa destructor]|uniref:Uncharacterized protein n=1 Tax=Varroa destructor TaxID=109461 RepID=A0A7M7JGQ6_VARDE|nr:centromere protein F-like isoform X4 [Varroa destructor]
MNYIRIYIYEKLLERPTMVVHSVFVNCSLVQVQEVTDRGADSGARGAETPISFPVEQPDTVSDSSALASSVYGTPRTQCSSADDSLSSDSRDTSSLVLAPLGSHNDGSSSPASSAVGTPTTRQRSTINIEKYEQALKDQRAAIEERNLVIKQLTDKLRATAAEQDELLKSEREHVRGLEMELDALKRKAAAAAAPESNNNNSGSINKSVSEYSFVELRLAEADITMKQQRNQLECERKQNASIQQQAHIYELQVRSLQGRLREATQEIQSWRSKVGEAENRVKAMEDRNRGLEGELSEVKTQLIWASEEHEQVRVKLQARESEYKRIKQDLQLRTDSLREATKRLEALRRYETESNVIHKSLQQLKDELNQSLTLNRSLKEERDQLQAQLANASACCGCYGNQTISEQTQYLDFPQRSPIAVSALSLPGNMRNEVNDLLARWPDCGVTQEVENIGDLVAVLKSIREYVLRDKVQLEEELQDVLKEGQQVQSLHDVVGVVQILKAYGLQGRRVPGLEAEIRTLKVKLADCEAHLDQSEKEVERLRAVESGQPFVEEIAQKLYALPNENLQLQHKNLLLEGQMAKHSQNTTPTNPNCSNFEEKITATTPNRSTTPSAESFLLFDTTPLRANPLRVNTPPRCLLDMTNITCRTENNGDEGQCNSLLTENISSFFLTLEEFQNSADNLQVEKSMLINQLNDKLVDEKSKRNFKKLMDIWEYEKLALYNEFTEKVALNQKQTSEAVEQKYLAQIESLAAKWECEKNSALHDQLLRYLHDLSEPMTVHDHIVAIRALLEKDLLGSRFLFSCKLKAQSETEVLRQEKTDGGADGDCVRDIQLVGVTQLYEQLCDTIEKCRLNFEDLCGSLIKEVNATKDALVLKDNNRINQLECTVDDTRNLLVKTETHLNKLTQTKESLEAQLSGANKELSELQQKLNQVSEANDRLLDIITKMKKILGVECEDKMLPAILDEMLTMSEVSGGLSLADLAKALRDGAELAEEAKKALIMRLGDSQMSFDMSTMSGVSAVSIAEDQLSKLRKEYDLLQQRLRQVEDERDLLESTSIISDVETGYEVKLSDSLIKLVGELRQEKNKNKELRQKLDESITQGANGIPQGPSKRVMCFGDEQRPRLSLQPQAGTPTPSAYRQKAIQQERLNLKFALQSNERLLSILSDVVKTCVSCDQDIIRALEAVGVVEVSGSARNISKDRDRQPEVGGVTHTPIEKAVEEEEPLFSLGSALNASRDEGMNGPYPSKEELNDLLMEDALELPLVSLHEGADPQDDMVLVPSRRLRASVAQMVDFIKSSHSQWTAKTKELEERLARNEEELKDEERVREDLCNQLAQAKEKVIIGEETRDRLTAELLELSGQRHHIEHAFKESEVARLRLEEQLEEAKHMGLVEQKQRKILEAAAAAASAPIGIQSGRDSSDNNAKESIDVALNRLTEENCRLERENLSLTRSCERQISLRNERISVLEQKLEELAHERDQAVEEAQAVIRERDEQLEAMERQLQQNKKFFSEVSQEKDAECEALEREIRNLQDTLSRERSRRSTALDEDRQVQLDSLETELREKSTAMEAMARRRSELEIELKCAREKIDDLTEVINRLEQDLTARKIARQLGEQFPEPRSLSPASESQVSEQNQHQLSTSEMSTNHQDMETSFRVLKEQLRAKEGAARQVEKQQTLLHEVSSRLRMMAERMHSLIAPLQTGTSDGGVLALKEPEEDLLSPSSSVHLAQVQTFENSLEKLLQLVETLRKTEIKLRQKVAQLEGEFKEQENEISEYQLKNAELLNKLEARQVDMTQPSIFASDLQRQVITAEKKAEGLENELKIAEDEVRTLKDTKNFLEERMDVLVRETQTLRKKLAVYEDCISFGAGQDELDLSSSSSRSSPRRMPLTQKNQAEHQQQGILMVQPSPKGSVGSLCRQCTWMKELLEKQDLELRRLRIDAFEKSVAERDSKRDCASVCSSSEMSSSPDGYGSHQSVQLQTSFRDASLNRELQEEILTLRSEKSLLEHRKGVHEAKCSTLQSEVNKLNTLVEQLRNEMKTMVPLIEHGHQIRQLEESLNKEKMDAVGELEIQWQDRVEQERKMHIRVLQEKDCLLRDHQEALSSQKIEKEFLSEQLRLKAKELRDVQSTLAAKEQMLTKVTKESQKLRKEIEKHKEQTEQVVKETGLKIKEQMDRKINELVSKLQESRKNMKDAEDRIEANEKVLRLCSVALQRRVDADILAGLADAFPQCGSLQWLEGCEKCPALQTALDEARSEIESLRNLVRAGQSNAIAEEELVALLHKLYWVFRRSESRRLQLLVQKSYLQNCALRQLEFPARKRTLKTAAIVIMAVYRMKHRRLRWTMAAVASPDKAAVIAKISPYIQSVPRPKDLQRALQPATNSNAANGSSRYPNHVSKFPQVEGVSIPLEQRPWPIVPGKSTTVLSPGRQRGHRDEDGLQIRQRKIT